MFRKNLESDQIILKTKQDCILIYNATVLEKNILLILHIVITSLSADVLYAMTYIPKFDIKPSLSKKTFFSLFHILTSRLGLFKYLYAEIDIFAKVTFKLGTLNTTNN